MCAYSFLCSKTGTIAGIASVGTVLFIKDPIFRGVCLVMMATPVGSMTVMLAQQYNGDYRLTSRGVALTTLLSVITMPFLFWALKL